MKKLETYGEPCVAIGGLRIWIHNRQNPEADDFWDANWVDATASCADNNASVTAEGPILHLSEIEQWLRQLETVHRKLSGEAVLECMEPNLRARIECDKLGHMKMEVAITPDHLTQQHAFTIDFDQTHLGGLIEDCRKILAAYPIKQPMLE